MARVAILSSDKLPSFFGPAHPTEKGLFAEDDALIAALQAEGVAAKRVVWRSQDTDWHDLDLAIIRSTWDYIEDLDAFLDLLARIEAAGCRLMNPAKTVRWNLDKSYLLDLAARGATTVPSLIVDDPRDAESARRARDAGFGELIVKPTIGVGAFETHCLPGAAALCDLPPLSGARYVIQPFLESVRREGEWSFVFLDGDLGYAALKRAAGGEFRVQVMYGGMTEPREPDPEDARAARTVFESLPVPAGYARIDMARLDDGRLALMEAELIEPQLFLTTVEGSAARLAQAVLSWLHD